MFLGLFVLDLWANNCQTNHVTSSPRPWLWRSCRCPWFGSSCSNCVPSFKFLCLSVQKIWRISGLSISRPHDLDLWPWNWCALLPVGWATFLQILVIPGRFVLDASANNCQTFTWPCDLDRWPWKLEVMALVCHTSLRISSVYQVWSS